MNRSALVCMTAALSLGAATHHALAQARGGATGVAPARVQQIGANVPFTTYEAENAVVGGGASIVRMTSAPGSTTTNPEIEASGRAYARLDATGEWVEFRNVRKANGMVLRHCTPDNSTGTGVTTTLRVYVNGVHRQTLSLSSRNNWLYGEAGENGQSNNPADGSGTGPWGGAHVFWTDTRFFISGGLKAGDNLRFQKDGPNAAAYYLIDLVDLEIVPPARPAPPAGTYVNVLDYGATGTGTGDDSDEIEDAIAAARGFNPRRTVWIPAGTFYSNNRLTVDGVSIQGAGMWRTSLMYTGSGSGFQLRNNRPRVQDLSIISTRGRSRSASGQTGGDAFPSQPTDNITNWAVRGVWIQFTEVGFWLRGASNGVINGCRIYQTYADAINLNRGSNNNLVVNNYIRGAGDDGLAILSQNYDNPTNLITHNITMRNNTVIANWWGHNADLAGGYGHVMEYNYLADNSHAGVFTINNPSAFPMFPLENSMVRGNVILRGGSNYASQKRGAVWIFPGASPITNVTFRDNKIIDSIYRGIHIRGSFPQDITFENNLIENPRENAIYVESSAQGIGRFINTTIRRLNGFSAIRNDGGSDYTLTQQNTVIQ